MGQLTYQVIRPFRLNHSIPTNHPISHTYVMSLKQHLQSQFRRALPLNLASTPVELSRGLASGSGGFSAKRRPSPLKLGKARAIGLDEDLEVQRSWDQESGQWSAISGVSEDGQYARRRTRRLLD
jgi:hypothetical protein